MDEGRDLEGIFDIDKDSLDREWVRQPKLYFRYAEKLADANAEVAREKTQLDLARAMASKLVRLNPQKFGLERVSEGAIANALTSIKMVRVALKRFNRAQHEADVIQAAVRALDHKKKALESLVFLHGQNYFSSPKTPKGEAGQAVQDMVKRAIRRRGKANLVDEARAEVEERTADD